jgi:hypothetical protein
MAGQSKPLDPGKLRGKWHLISTIAYKTLNGTGVSILLAADLIEQPVARYIVRVGMVNVDASSLSDAVKRFNEIR